MPISAFSVVALLGAIASLSPGNSETASDSSLLRLAAVTSSDSLSRSKDSGTPHKSPAKDTTRIQGTAKSPLCGPLLGQTLRWGPKQGPLHISGTVVVGQGQALIIAAGTTVLTIPEPTCVDTVNSGDGATLLVAGGSLVVQGLPRNPVVFQPSTQGKGFGWGGIRVERAHESTVDLAWLELRRARTGIAFVAGSGEMRHSVVDGCGIGIAALAGAAPRILHCVVSGSLLADAVSERSAPLFRSCLFLDGRGDGIRFQGTGLARVENSCFWGHRGTQVVRGPDGLGGWKYDTVPDRFGNWRRDPVLRGSALDRAATDKKRLEVAAAPWWKHSRMPDLPYGYGPWALSAFSPLLGAGEMGLCQIPNGTRCDVGLWSGP